MTSETIGSHQVDVKYGLAADVLKSLILNGEACR